MSGEFPPSIFHGLFVLEIKPAPSLTTQDLTFDTSEIGSRKARADQRLPRWSEEGVFPGEQQMEQNLLPNAVKAVKGARTDGEALALIGATINTPTRGGRTKEVQVGSYISSSKSKVHERLAAKAVSLESFRKRSFKILQRNGQLLT